MTLTQAERDWLDALWRQAERDAEAEWRQLLDRFAPYRTNDPRQPK